MVKQGIKNQMGVILAIVTIFLTGVAIQANALPLPVLDFQGLIKTTVDDSTNSIIDKEGGVGVTQYVDIDGVLHDIWPWTSAAYDDPILGQPVIGAMLSGISYDWANDVLTVNPNATAIFQIGFDKDFFLRADVTDIKVLKTDTRRYEIDARLSNQTLKHLNDSKFMADYNDAIGSGGIGQLVTWDVVFDIKEFVDLDGDGTDDANIYGVNISGKVAPAPVPEPATIMLMGAGLIGIGGAARKKVFKKS